MPTPNRKTVSPKDFTGAAKAKLMAEQAAKIAERQGDIAMFNQQQAVAADIPIRLDDSGREVEVAQEVPDGPVPLEKQKVFVKFNCDLEHVTVGQGDPRNPGMTPEYNFKEGQTYEVPRHVADHLGRLGYVLFRY
jgi:hypothetical protein